MKKIDKRKFTKSILDYFLIAVGAFCIASATYIFTVPAKFIPGGVTGIASMVEVLFGFSVSYTIAILNVPILICALILLDKKLAVRSVFGIICLTGFLELFKLVDMYRFYNYSQPWVSALIAGGLSGVGVGLLFQSTSSPGGTELMGMLIQKKLKYVKISYILMALNIVIIAIGAVMYSVIGNMKIEDIIIILVCSILQVVINSSCIDLVVNGINSAVKFEIVTANGKAVSDALIRELEYGVTIINSQGAYSEAPKQLLICVVPKLKISVFKSIIHKTDPDAFVFSINTREVMGKKFKKNL